MTDQDQFHTALLNLGGRVPDAMLAEARLRLADTGTVPLPEPESTVELAFTFAASQPGGKRAFSGQAPPLTDMAGRVGLMDGPDQAAVRAAEQQPGAVALWRSWRIAPEWAASVIPPAPVYVVETTGPLAGTAAAIMRTLAAIGITAPLVEVYPTGGKLAPYTAAARNSSALLWVDRDTEPLRIARVFDVVDDAGARFGPEHERLSGDDLAQVAAYLDAGSPVLATTSRMTDVVEPGRGQVVPATYRTDGRWLWPESVAYYLREYGLAPQPEFTGHIRSCGRLLPVTDPADEHRALAVLFQSHAVVPAP
ncbi:hypothetical protein [Actinoplanes derwentensis]|uniref:Uncharacterized protein n=1 Tax=Actinoplanes derwentensis TaxID=113562 RepID=A0A1H2BE14_9ACTN|nr:hypothetical protein [Actinoplanes derwentensis]GID89313.1 hypothetical protein Ade03nite_82370 [Actinoplanes derwentensis]SDT56503.1 hypothetical protein SAMN04489716_4546 [Actinoplanes derwentensis]